MAALFAPHWREDAYICTYMKASQLDLPVGLKPRVGDDDAEIGAYILV